MIERPVAWVMIVAPVTVLKTMAGVWELTPVVTMTADVWSVSVVGTAEAVELGAVADGWRLVVAVVVLGT